MRWLVQGALTVVELAAKEYFTPPAGFTLIDERRYGATRVAFLRWSS
jgi:16S rRNA (guanine966-N2)-methyltransferase